MSVVTICVTKEDIARDQANPDSRTKNCGIFHAAKRVIPNISHVAPYAIKLLDGTVIPLPRIAKQYVRMSDVHASLKLKKLKFDPNDVDMEPLKAFEFQVQYTTC